jgi:hypothetical protein
MHMSHSYGSGEELELAQERQEQRLQPLSDEELLSCSGGWGWQNWPGGGSIDF